MLKIRFGLEKTRFHPAQFYTVGEIENTCDLEFHQDSKVTDERNASEFEIIQQEFGKSLGRLICEYSNKSSTIEWNGHDAITAWFFVRTTQLEFARKNHLTIGKYDFNRETSSYDDLYACIGHVFSPFGSNVVNEKQFQSNGKIHLGKFNAIEDVDYRFGNLNSTLEWSKNDNTYSVVGLAYQ